jgi:hypothetical protein
VETQEAKDREYDSTSGCLIRVFWMLVGNAMLLLCGIAILQNQSSLLGGADACYWVVMGGLLAARYLDIRYFDGKTADGHPATWDHWRRYAVRVLAVCTVVWLVLHAVAWPR